jgi:hypothetical protein
MHNKNPENKNPKNKDPENSKTLITDNLYTARIA